MLSVVAGIRSVSGFVSSRRIPSLNSRVLHTRTRASTEPIENIIIGNIIKSSSCGAAILEARDGAQNSAGPGNLLDLGNGDKGFVVWARPPIYFVQVLPGANGEIPSIAANTQAELCISASKTASTKTKEVPGPLSTKSEHSEEENGSNSEDVEKLGIGVGDVMLGRIVDYQGQPIDGLGDLVQAGASDSNDEDDEDDASLKELLRVLPVFNEEPVSGSTESLTRGMLTGITAIDSLTPLGKGQTMFVVGGQGVGRTEMVLDAVQAQASRGVRCVWACISGGKGQAEALQGELEARGAASNTVFVAGPDAALAKGSGGSGSDTNGDDDEEDAAAAAASTAALQFATAAAALSVGEGFRNAGLDSLVVLDDLSPLSALWDHTTVTLLELFGKDRADLGGDSEMRGFYSSLLQRNAQLGALYGGGSMSALVLMDEAALKARAAAEGEEDSGDGGAEQASSSEGSEAKKAYTLADFDGPFYANKTRARLALLDERGVALTNDVLDKLGIPRPSPSEARAALLATMHVDQLISLADGHIMLSPSLLEAGLTPPVDPSNSLTRIGVGSEFRRTISSSVHAAAIQKVAKRLRLELAVLSDLRYASTAADVAAANRAVAWQAALTQPGASPLSLSSQVCRLHAVEVGLLDRACEAALARASGGGEGGAASAVSASDVASAPVRKAASEAVGVLLNAAAAKAQEKAPSLFAAVDATEDITDVELKELTAVMAEAVEEATAELVK